MDGMTRVRPAPAPQQLRISDGESYSRGVLQVGHNRFGTLHNPKTKWLWLLWHGDTFGHVRPVGADQHFELKVFAPFDTRVSPEFGAEILDAVEALKVEVER